MNLSGDSNDAKAIAGERCLADLQTINPASVAPGGGAIPRFSYNPPKSIQCDSGCIMAGTAVFHRVVKADDFYAALGFDARGQSIA